MAYLLFGLTTLGLNRRIRLGWGVSDMADGGRL